MVKKPGRPSKAAGPSAPSIVVTVRFTPEIKAALEQAAEDDARTVSGLLQKITADWLKAQKRLK